ncbi:transposase [Roseomonas sp. M0104]|uniref:Transposase n=1 Tax=Teichococcus coralli TaxID=2545983 RepID=A0A845BGC5_9PROT|nr:transposase [Pseudoroseomonas coralli]
MTYGLWSSPCCRGSGRSREAAGRAGVGSRRLGGILFVPRRGIQWHEVPTGLGCCGKACWRRRGAWQAAGVWARPLKAC